jgi:hypothetical protein
MVDHAKRQARVAGPRCCYGRGAAVAQTRASLARDRLQATGASLLAASPCIQGEVCARKQQGHERGDRPHGPYGRLIARCVAEPVLGEPQQRYERRHNDTEDVHANQQPSAHLERHPGLERGRSRHVVVIGELA